MIAPPPPFFFGEQNNRHGSGGKCDAPVAAKYLIITTSFSGRLRLHLGVSLSVYDLEMKDWQHSYVREGHQVVCVTVNPHPAAILRVPPSGQAPLVTTTATSGVILEFIDQSPHEITTPDQITEVRCCLCFCLNVYIKYGTYLQGKSR